MAKSNACMHGRHLEWGWKKPGNRETNRNDSNVAVIDPSTEPPTLYKCTEEDTLIIRGEKDTKQHTKMICDNQNERGYVQLTADRRTKSAHQLWSFPATCFPRDCVYCLREYARNSARVEATQNANKTKHNTQHPPTPKPPPFSSCRIWQEIVSTPVDKYKQIPVSKGHPTGLDWCVVCNTAGSSATVLFWVSRGHIQQVLLFTVTVLGLKSRVQQLLLFWVSRGPFNYLRISAEFTQTNTSCTSCLDNYWFESARN